MARKKITPEEETPKTVTLEESTAADVGDMTQNDLPPGESGTAEGRGAETVPTTEPAEDADDTSVGGDPPKEDREENLAETASAEMSSADISAEEKVTPAPKEEASAAEEGASRAEPPDAISAAVESVLDARSKDTAGPETKRDADGVDITPGKLLEIHEAHEAALEPPEYSIDLSEEPEPVPARDAAPPDAEEDDWGFREPRREVTEEEAPAQPTSIVLPVRPAPSVPSVPSVRTKAAVKSDRQLFFELKFNAVYSVYRRVAVRLYVKRLVFYKTAVLFCQYHEKIAVVFSAHVERHKIIRGGCVGVVENHAVNIFSVVSRPLGILQFEKIQRADIVVRLAGIDNYAVFVPLEIIFDISAFEAKLRAGVPVCNKIFHRVVELVCADRIAVFLQFAVREQGNIVVRYPVARKYCADSLALAVAHRYVVCVIRLRSRLALGESKIDSTAENEYERKRAYHKRRFLAA